MNAPTDPRTAVVLVVASWLCTAVAPALAVDDLRAPLDESCWQLSFDEPFDTLSLHDEASDEGRWKPAYIWGPDIVINEELQYYVDPRVYRHQPFEIEKGVLNIIASPTPPALAAAANDQPYLSGVLTTENSFSQKHGRFEVRARVPEGRGLWSAFWLLPSFEQWPEGVDVLPEIDVMEHIGHEPSVFHTTLHTNQDGQLDSYPHEHRTALDLTADFHRYSVVWTAQQVRWYLDGEWVASHPTPEDFTRPVHFLLNLAVGGTWPGKPAASTSFPARFEIDYVRAYTAVTSESCTAS